VTIRKTASLTATYCEPSFTPLHRSLFIRTSIALRHMGMAVSKSVTRAGTEPIGPWTYEEVIHKDHRDLMYNSRWRNGPFVILARWGQTSGCWLFDLMVDFNGHEKVLAIEESFGDAMKRADEFLVSMDNAVLQSN
jgi:hypothetical protein